VHDPARIVQLFLAALPPTDPILTNTLATVEEHWKAVLFEIEAPDHGWAGVLTWRTTPAYSFCRRCSVKVQSGSALHYLSRQGDMSRAATVQRSAAPAPHFNFVHISSASPQGPSHLFID
jgi:hypothetical protein